MKAHRSPLGEIPNPFTCPEGIFRSLDEARFAIQGILRAYFDEVSDGADYLFFRGAHVRFERNPQIDVELDHRERKIIFVIEEPKGKNAAKLKAQIRRDISLQYAAVAADARGRTAMSIYRALDHNAKQAVVASEKQQ